MESEQGKVSSEMWKVKATVGQNENMIKEKHYSFSFAPLPTTEGEITCIVSELEGRGEAKRVL